MEKHWEMLNLRGIVIKIVELLDYTKHNQFNNILTN
jgi:hypothetical protein